MALLMLVLASSFGFTQGRLENEAGKETRREHLEAFKSKHDDRWEIHWNDALGIPAAILGHRTSGYQGTPERIARQFLQDEKKCSASAQSTVTCRLKKLNFLSEVGRVCSSPRYSRKYPC
jgi:hypothetical protein